MTTAESSKSAEAFAPGKIILFGEHAVVYGRPAIAVPVLQVQANAVVRSTGEHAVRISAPGIGRRYSLASARPDDPIATIIRLTCSALGVAPERFVVHIQSTIPVARGLGSGAAVSVAIARALGNFFDRPFEPEALSALAYECEKLYHGTPSGIDNTVIAFARPVYFVRGQPLEPFQVARPFLIAIGDTGVSSPTKIAVGDVRRAWEADQPRFEALFDRIGEIARQARRHIEQGSNVALGELMNQNQDLAHTIGVSSPEIERLVEAARGSGALGAKLSGAGRGGNVIALVDDDTRKAVERAMLQAGAKRVITTEVKS